MHRLLANRSDLSDLSGIPGRRADRLALAAVLGVALLWRVMLWLSLRDTPLAHWHLWDQSDMASFLAQARALAGGDWLARTPWHPYHGWMRIAPPEAWQAWFARPAFYQAPFYSYFLAGLMRLGLDVALWGRLANLALGTASAGLVFVLARRQFGRGAGLAAGLLMGVYGPLLVVESQLLRDTMILFWTLLAFATYQAWARRPRPAPAVALGALLGALAMLHEGAALLGVALLGAGVLRLRRRGGWRRAAGWATLVAAGALAGYAPLLARNLAVGAPLPPRFAGSAFAWAVANHATAAWGGATWIAPAPALGEAIARGGGSVPALVGEVLGSYDGQWWRWLGHWGMRLAALGIGGENPENVSQAYFVRRVPLLALTVDFRVLAPLALTGALLWGRRRWAAAVRGGAPAAALAVNFALVAGMLSVVLPLGRYRLMFLPCLMPLAGLALARLGAAWRARQTRRLAWGLGLAALFAAGQWGLGRALPFDGPRPADFGVAARILMNWGRPDLARRELLDSAAAGLDPREFDESLAVTEEALGQEARAAALFERALERNPQSALACQHLGWLRASARDGAVRRPAQAIELARRHARLRGEGAESLDLLAAALAVGGDFAGACQAAERALAAAPNEAPALAPKIAARLALYRQGRPFVR